MDFHTFVRSQPRPFPDPYIEWHLQQYDIVTDLKYDLEALTSKPLLTIEDLSDLAVVRDGEFNIDEDKPIDIGTVFFSIGSLKEVAECVASYQELKSWPELPPGDEHLLNHWDLPLSDIDHVQHYSHLCWRLVEWVNRYSINQGRFTHRENKNWIKPAWFAHHPSMVHGIPGPEVSHTVLMVSDTIKPDDRLLRSELLMAAMLIRDNLAQGFWRGHHTLPAAACFRFTLKMASFTSEPPVSWT
ncbi:hypothetical protein Trco_003813 [Trichoderma cornu-damae]|uniref:Uncharacterized protein n=1 Tax=Trichoderma cornu-damae TaxID=654480 RepID=A0A9P8QPY9_9HYPO|nr:hypothetical protein Trco_003813 [Trichoderma cornu-damae]